MFRENMQSRKVSTDESDDEELPTECYECGAPWQQKSRRNRSAWGDLGESIELPLAEPTC